MEPKTVGTLFMETYRPNILRIRWNDELTTLEIAAMLEYTEAVRRELGSPDAAISAIIDVGSGVQIHKSARKAIMDMGRAKPFFRSAIVGAPYRIKVLLELTINAIRLIVPDTAESQFFDTEEEGLAWLMETESEPAT